jgi:hypothetical protein
MIEPRYNTDGKLEDRQWDSQFCILRDTLQARDAQIASLTAERDSFERLFHSVNDAANQKYDDDLDRARRDVHQANIEIAAQNKVIEELKREKAEDWKAACESARIASGTVYDLRRKYEQVKKELEEIKNSSTPITWGVRNTKDTQYKVDLVWSCCSTEELAKGIFPEHEGWEHFPLYSGPKYTITKEDIDQLSRIADRLDYAQFYESANSLRSFIARNK